METNMKKPIIIYILKVLYSYTSFEYPVTQTSLAEYLNDIEISCDRKTVGRNLRCLMRCGLPIKRKNGKNGGYYYDGENDTFFVRKTMEEDA